nr:serine/threonine-protein kinase [Duganella flavida]
MSGHYEVRDCLGEGGFGTVFAAWDNKLRRAVAIKRLKNLGDPTQSARLVQEAQLAASLQHPAFVKIYALEDSGEAQSIVMELVHGQTLKQLLGQSPMHERQALDIVCQIAEAMRDAHASGLVHGDLKPSNVMVQPENTVRILDFGLAIQADPQATTSVLQTDPQGTIAYMAPERLLGQPLRASSDIYALGVIFYELLTGARPFSDLNGLALAAAHMQTSSAQWPYPATVRAALIQLMHNMTATPVEQRLQTMQQVCERLAILLDQPAAQTQSPAKRVLRWQPAWRKPVLSLGAALALAAGGWWFARSSPTMLTSLQAVFQPYSEAQEMQVGLQALATWDRPGELEKAEKKFTTILDQNRDNVAAIAGLALVYCRRFSSDHQDEIWLRKADAAAKQALHLNDQLALSHIAQADVLAMAGKNEAALTAFDRALTLDPANIFGLSGRINVLHKQRQDDTALASAQEGLRRYPAERVFADQVGTIQYARARFHEAELAFRQSIQIQPDAVYSYANLSAALAAQGKQDEALHILQQGLQIRPSAWLYGNLGNILFLRNDYIGAAAAFESAVAPTQGSPGDYLGWANLGDTLLWIPGREADARKAYARASELLAPRLSRSPDDVTLLSRMGLYYARSGDKQHSLPLLQRSLTLAPAAAGVQFRAGLAYELLGERQLALAAIKQAIHAGYPVQFIEATPELLALRRDPAYAPR